MPTACPVRRKEKGEGSSFNVGPLQLIKEDWTHLNDVAYDFLSSVERVATCRVIAPNSS